MITLLNTKDENTASKIITLQKKAYMEEARLINFYDIPALKETLSDIQKCGETFYGWWDGIELAAIVSYKLKDGILDIYRVAVSPAYFRRGIAKKLLEHIEAINNCPKIAVQTGAANYPARQLYLSRGFVHTGEHEVMEGLTVALFEKETGLPDNNV